MSGVGYKAQISQALQNRVELVSKANGYSQDIKTVTWEKVRLNIQDYEDRELPAVQIIGTLKNFNHEMSRSKSVWYPVLEVCLRTTQTIGIVDQGILFDLTEDVIRAVMAEPKLGLPWVVMTRLVDELSGLHLQEPNYIATIGLEVMYYEPITRDNC